MWEPLKYRDNKPVHDRCAHCSVNTAVNADRICERCYDSGHGGRILECLACEKARKAVASSPRGR